MNKKIDYVVEILEREESYIKKRLPFDFRGHFAVRGELSSVREPFGMVKRLKELNKRGDFFIGTKEVDIKHGNKVHMSNPLGDKEPIECEVKALENDFDGTCYPEPTKRYIGIKVSRDFSGVLYIEYKIA